MPGTERGARTHKNPELEGGRLFAAGSAGPELGEAPNPAGPQQNASSPLSWTEQRGRWGWEPAPEAAFWGEMCWQTPASPPRALLGIPASSPGAVGAPAAEG